MLFFIWTLANPKVDNSPPDVSNFQYSRTSSMLPEGHLKLICSPCQMENPVVNLDRKFMPFRGVGFPLMGWESGMGHPPPSQSHNYFKKQKPIKNDALPHEALPLLKNKISLTDKQTPSIVKWGPHSRKWFLKKPWKIRNCHNTCVSIIKQHWKKMAEIQQKHDFLTWNIQNFARNSLLESSILLN